MATVNPTVTNLNNKAWKFVWVLDSTNSDGAPIQASRYAEFTKRTVYVTGTFGTATFAMEGGDGTAPNWITLTDPQGNAITKTAAGIELIEELPEYMRPNLSVPGAGATLTVTLIAHK